MCEGNGRSCKLAGLKSLIRGVMSKIPQAQRPQRLHFVFVVDESVFSIFKLDKAPPPSELHGLPLSVEVLKV